MRRLDHHVAALVDELLLAPCVRAPEDEHDPFGLLVHCLDHRVGEGLPALALVGCGLVGADGERRVEEQDASTGPGLEAARAWRRIADVGLELLEDVHERGRSGYPGPDR